MTDDDYQTMKGLIADVVRTELTTQLQTLCLAVLAPIVSSQNEMQKSLGMLIQGQALIEKHLAGPFEDEYGDPWNEGESN